MTTPPKLPWPTALLVDHAAWAGKPLPKGWEPISIHSTQLRRRLMIYVNSNLQQAQWEHPSSKAHAKIDPLPEKVHDSLKRRKKVPLLVPCNPQPPGLVKGWIQVVAIPPSYNAKKANNKVIPELLYLNYNGVSQTADPGPPPEDHVYHTLPEGWEQDHDAEGDAFYVNRNTYTTTYDDPRIFADPEPSTVLNLDNKKMRQNRRLSTISLQQADGAKKSAWHVSARDQFAFNLLDYRLAKYKELPEYAQNKRVNRYLDIVPHLRTQVMLKQLGDDPLSTYINANWVTGFPNNDQKFIAAMGPLPDTIVAFWRMVTEHNCDNIVMLTNLVEKGRKKCEQYFPILEADKVSYGPFTITNKKRVECNGFVYSTMLVEAEGRKPKTVVHWWFNTWPDHDVPRDHDGNVYVETLLNLIRMVKKADTSPFSPILVHCSAGVGRTGTFVAIHTAQEELHKHKKTDLIKIVEGMRANRSAMVQHLSQFLFVHDAVSRYCEQKGKAYVIDGSDVEATMDSMSVHDEVLESAIGDDEVATTLVRKKMRRTEKDAAKARLADYEAKLASGTSRKLKRTDSEKHGEMKLGTINYKGAAFHFNDVNGDGVMDWGEAQQDGYPKELFDIITDGSAEVTVANYLKYQATVRKKVYVGQKAERVATGTGSSKPHEEMDAPWYAGELPLRTVVRIVQNSTRGNFIIRRSHRDPSDFHIICCIQAGDGHIDAGKYAIKYDADQQHYTFSSKPYRSLQKIVAACKKHALLRDGKGEFLLQDPAKVFDHGSNI